MKCPKCETELEPVSYLTGESSLSMSIVPKDGQLLSLDTLGGCMSNMSELMTALGDKVESPTRCLVTGLSVAEDGTVKFDFLVTRVADAHYAHLTDNENGTSATDDAKETGKTTGDNT